MGNLWESGVISLNHHCYLQLLLYAICWKSFNKYATLDDDENMISITCEKPLLIIHKGGLSLTYQYFIRDAIEALARRQPISGHTPGHKNGAFLPEALTALWGTALGQYDVTELVGLDDLHSARGCIGDSQRQAARIYQADRSYYLVNGTTAGLQAAIMATCYQQEVFVPRHAHRCVYHSLILAKARPVYLPISMDPESGLPLGVKSAVLEEYIKRYPQCRRLILVHPTYQGITWENAACIQMAKQHGLTIIADEAHGAHLHFHETLPPSALDLGADLVVQSWHKTLPVLTQGSVLHVGKAYQGPPLDGFLSMLQTTSPSYLLMASLEAGSIYMGQAGSAHLGKSIAAIEAFRQKLRQLPTIQLLWQPQWKQDPFKLYLQSHTLSGPQLAQRLQAEFSIYAEMSDQNGCLLILPINTTAEWLAPVWQALVQIDSDNRLLPERKSAPDFYCQRIPQQMLPLPQAFYAEKKQICWQDAAGCIAGQFLLRYPPGIPLVVPGEIITEEIIDLWQHSGDNLAEPVLIIEPAMGNKDKGASS